MAIIQVHVGVNIGVVRRENIVVLRWLMTHNTDNCHVNFTAVSRRQPVEYVSCFGITVCRSQVKSA